MPRTLGGILILMLLVSGNAVAVSIRSPRRPRTAAESREIGRSSVRTALFVLVLTAVATAGEASWKAEICGENVFRGPTPGHASGNAMKMEVTAHSLGTNVDAYVHTDPFAADQDGVAEDSDTAWFTLKFAGSESSTGHHWRITSSIDGKGSATADPSLDGSAWGDSIQSIVFSGDHTNRGQGQLAVQCSAPVKVALQIPSGLGIILDKTQRRRGEDSFDVSRAQTTTGPGKCCRARVDTYAKAQLAGTCTFGIAFASLDGWLCSSLEMVGTCYVGDRKVIDTFRLTPADPGEVESETKTPSGGIEKDAAEIPPDAPSEAEREGDFDEEPGEDAAAPDSGATTATPTDDAAGTGTPEDDADGSSEAPVESPPEEDDSGGSTPAGGFPPPSAA